MPARVALVRDDPASTYAQVSSIRQSNGASRVPGSGASSFRESERPILASTERESGVEAVTPPYIRQFRAARSRPQAGRKKMSRVSEPPANARKGRLPVQPTETEGAT